MNPTGVTRTALLLALALAAPCVARAEGEGQALGDGAAEAPAPKPRPGVVTFPGIRIDTRARTIEVDAWFVVVKEGAALEFAAVTDRGKMHESLLALECAPEKLHLGLILLGLEPLPEVLYQGEARALSGPRLSIDVTFEREEEGVAKKVTTPLESLIYDRFTGEALTPLGFAFTGSRFLERRAAPGEAPGPPVFAAERTGNVIALYHDPDACLDNPRLEGGDIPLVVPTFGGVELLDWLAADDRLFPYAPRLPERGTGATLTLRPIEGEKGEGEAEEEAGPPPGPSEGGK